MTDNGFGHHKRTPDIDTIQRQAQGLANFEGVEFMTYISSFNTGKNGELFIKLKVGHEWKHDAFKLADVQNIPLYAKISVWEPYQEALGND